MLYSWVAAILIHLVTMTTQQMNLTKDGTTKQSTTFLWYHSNLAVDNNASTCAFSQNGKPFAWWMISFPKTAFVTSVSMIYRNLTLYRFRSYSLHITNSTMNGGNKPNGLCYQHNNSTPNRLQERKCYALGTNVIVYNVYKDPQYNSAYMELCEVKVYGCYKGWTGPNCTMACPFNCLNSNCYPENGTCFLGCNAKNCLNDNCNASYGECEDGCKAGFKGKMCNESCDAGKYGLKCSYDCGKCYRPPCNPVNGLCSTDGCARGFNGSKCDTKCGNGHYGFNCNSTCLGCISNACDGLNGVCENSTHCKPGWLGNKCNQRCEYGKFGNNCFKVCHCLNQPCDAVTGICPFGGCIKGYNGSTCERECTSGNFGFNCNETCTGCVSSACKSTDGVCNNKTHCKPGWFGPKCNQPCTPGTFGRNCTEICHCVNQPCNHITGVCLPGGCNRGYYENNCATECRNGHYGFNCNATCAGCVSSECNKSTGICKNKTHCQPGWFGAKCNQPCISGKFGRNCSEVCHCAFQPCSHTTGICPPGGCDRGYVGNDCAAECEYGFYGYNCIGKCRGCILNECEKFLGVCSNKTHCNPGWLGPNCEQPCSSGFFGKNCSQECHCMQLNPPCNHITGVCSPGGCDHGYYGDNCATASEENSNYNYSAVIGGLCSTAVAISILVAGIFFLRRKTSLHLTKRNEEKGHGQADTTCYDSFNMSGHEQGDNPYEELSSRPEESNGRNRTTGNESGRTSGHFTDKTYINLTF